MTHAEDIMDLRRPCAPSILPQVRLPLWRSADGKVEFLLEWVLSSTALVKHGYILCRVDGKPERVLIHISICPSDPSRLIFSRLNFDNDLMPPGIALDAAKSYARDIWPYVIPHFLFSRDASLS